MAWNLSADRPIYTQIMEILSTQIVSGIYPPGARLPSVRDLAFDAGVNPNTMQRAFAELERMGLIVTQRTAGRNVTQDAGLIEELRRKLAAGRARDFLISMKNLGFDTPQILQLLAEEDQPKAREETQGENQEEEQKEEQPDPEKEAML